MLQSKTAERMTSEDKAMTSQNETEGSASSGNGAPMGPAPAARSVSPVSESRPAAPMPSLPEAFPAERREITGRAGRLSYYVAGEGTPLLLIHSINAAGSAYEVRPVFMHTQARHRVYAVDLPGFGFSDRSDRTYDIRLFVDAVHDILDLIEAETGSRAIDAMALSLSSEFLARAATERQEGLRSLTFVTPTGFETGSSKRKGSEGSTRQVPFLYETLTVPLWSKGAFRLLTTRPSIRFFLEKTFGSKDIDEGLFNYAYETTHQDGARHAPYNFVSGRLFANDIRRIYEKLTLPIFLAHGTRGDFQDFSEVDWLRAQPNWTVKPFKTGAMVYFEQPEAFLASFEEFLASAKA